MSEGIAKGRIHSHHTFGYCSPTDRDRLDELAASGLKDGVVKSINIVDMDARTEVHFSGTYNTEFRRFRRRVLSMIQSGSGSK